MNIFKLSIFGFFFLLIANSCNSEKVDSPIDDNEKETHHPFLIVKKEHFQALRGKASEEPWKSMKENMVKDIITSTCCSNCNMEIFFELLLAYILSKRLGAKRHFFDWFILTGPCAYYVFLKIHASDLNDNRNNSSRGGSGWPSDNDWRTPCRASRAFARG